MEPGSGGKEDHEIQRNPYDTYFIRSKENDLRVSEPDLAEMTGEKKKEWKKPVWILMQYMCRAICRNPDGQRNLSA